MFKIVASLVCFINLALVCSVFIECVGHHTKSVRVTRHVARLMFLSVVAAVALQLGVQFFL